MFKVGKSSVQKGNSRSSRKSLAPMKCEGKTNGSKMKVGVAFRNPFLGKMGGIFQGDVLFYSRGKELVAVKGSTLDVFLYFDNRGMNKSI